MMPRAALFVLLLASPPQDSARELVERLRSDRIEERDAAMRKILDLGKGAAAALDAATRDPDAEVAGRARVLLRALDLRATLAPALLKAHPGLELRLASDERAWLELYQDHDDRCEAADLEPLAIPAIRAARTQEEVKAACWIAAERDHRSAIPELARLLEEGDRSQQEAAAHALGELRALEVADRVGKLLRHEDGNRRALAAFALGRMGARSWSRELARRLDDPDVAGQVYEAIRLLAPMDAAPELAGFLIHKDRAVRIQALRLLGEFRAPAAIPELVQQLGDRDAEIRRLASAALGVTRSPKALAPLVPLLKDEHPKVRGAAAYAVGHLRSKEPAGALIALLKEPAKDVRENALNALWWLGVREAVPAFRELLKDAPLRERAIQALGALEAREAIPDLRPFLKDKNYWVRFHTAVALGNIGAREALPDLLDCLKVDDGRIPGTVANILGLWGARDVVPELVAIARGSAPAEGRAAAIEALVQLDARDREKEIALLLKDPEGRLRGAAARALGLWKAETRKEELLQLLKDEDPKARAGAILGLTALGARDAFPKIFALRSDEENDVKLALGEALEKLPVREHADLIAPMMESTEWWDRVEAATILARLRGKAAHPNLMNLLATRDRAWVGSLFETAVSEGLLEAVPEMLRRLKDRDPQWRINAASALCRMGRREGIQTLLEDGGDEHAPGSLFWLNWLRRPELRNRLEEPVAVDVRTSRPEGVWERMAAGLGVRLEASALFPTSSWDIVHASPLGIYARLRNCGGQLNLRTACGEFLPRGWTVILETDRLRIVPHEEALAFWTEWARH